MRRSPVRSTLRTRPIILLLVGCLVPAAFAQAPPSHGSCGTQLLVGWPQSHRDNLVARLRSGTVAVQLEGCDMLPVDGCRVGGQYDWQHNTAPIPEQEPLSADAAAAVGAEGTATLQTVLSGQLVGSDGGGAVSSGCAHATHVIASVDLGAYEVRAADGRLISSAGNAAQCASGSETGPAPECAVPLRARLLPLPAPQGPPAFTHYIESSPGLQVTGITFTMLGGMALVVGLILSTDCFDPEPRVCTGGLITLGAGAVVTPIAIWMIVAGQPKTVYLSGDTRVDVGPTFVTGTF